MQYGRCGWRPACTSASLEPSYVLRALGLSDERANASIRLGLGRFTTVQDVDYATDALAAAAAHLRGANATIDGAADAANMKR